MHTKILALEDRAPQSLSRYAIALLSVTLAAAFTLAIRHWEYPGIAPFFPFFFGAVLASAWLGGSLPALLATVLSASTIIFFFQPFFTLSALGAYNSQQLVEFVLLSGVVCGLVAARARSEAAHRSSEQHYRLLFDRNLAGVFLSTLDGQILDCNESFARILGYDSCKEVLSHPSSDFYFDSAHRESYIKQLRKEGSVTTFEICLRGKDGKPVWIFENVSLIEDDTGVRTLLQGTIIDVAERKQAEEALIRSERHLVDAQRLASVGSWTWDIQTNSLTWSDELYQIYGRDQNNFLPTYETFLEFLHPDDREYVIESIESSVKTREPLDYYLRIIRLDGSERILHSRGIVIDDERGIPIRMVGAAQDVTEQRRAENALREAERKYHDIFEYAVEGIYRTTPDGRFIEANPALASMLGYDSPADLLAGRDDLARQSYVDPKRREEFKQLMGEHGMVRDFEFEVRRRDGSRIWISDNVRVVLDNNGEVLFYEGTSEDVTERKQAQEELKKREAQLADAQQLALLGSWEWDVESNAVIWSDEMYRIYGVDKQDFGATFEAVLQLIHADERASFVAQVERAYRFHETYTCEHRIVRPDGTLRLLDSRGEVELSDAGDVIRVFGYCQDITERKQIEEALHESEERYRDLVENSREFICTHDLDGLILSANRAASDVLGYDLKDYCGKMNFRDLLVPEVRNQFDDYLARIRRDGVASGLTLVQTSSGERLILEYYNTVRTLGVATPIVRGMARDITERKQAEKALQESEARFRQLSDAAFEALILHNRGTILEVNQSFCLMYGYERAEVIGKSVLDLTLSEFREPLQQRVHSEGTTPFEGLAMRKDGSIFRTEVAAKPIHYQGHSVRVAAIRDITEQKRNERRQAAQYAVTRVLAESATLDEATPQLLQVICESLRWKMGEFWRVCDGTNLLRCVETWHVPPLDATSFIEASRQIELAPGVGLPGRVWQSGEPAWIPDLMTDPRSARMAIAAEIGLRGAVAFPILQGDYTLGVMLFFSRRAPEVDDDLVKMMSAIGSQIGQFTERKRIEKALRESEERYRELFENAHDAIYVHDLNGNYISVNHAAEKLSGFSRSEIIGKNFAEFVAPKDLKRIRDRFREKLAGRKPKAYEIELIAKDGHRVHVEVDSRLIYEHGVAVGVQGMARDITDRKRAEEALRTFPRRLIGAQEAERRRVARELHDEIGQALTAIRINLQSVQQSADEGELTSQLDGSLKIIDLALQQVRNLALDLRPSLLDDLGLVAALRWYLNREATRAGLILELDIDLHRTRLAAEIETACFRITQEALTNIVRHAEAKRVSIELTLRDADLRLVVRDDGIGFDVAEAQHRFAAGASLGLQGMQERAIAVGGKLEIESSEATGTEVRVQLPFLPNLSSQEED